MKFEIITDTNDMIVLVVNSRIAVITEDISQITQFIEENYNNFLKRNRKLVIETLIYPELDDDMYKEKEIPVKEDKPQLSTENKVDNESLGKLFTL